MANEDKNQRESLLDLVSDPKEKMTTKLERLIVLYNTEIDNLIIHEVNIDYFQARILSEPEDKELYKNKLESEKLAKWKRKLIDIIKRHIIEEMTNNGEAN